MILSRRFTETFYPELGREDEPRLRSPELLELAAFAKLEVKMFW